MYMSAMPLSADASYASWLFGVESPYLHNISLFLQRAAETGLYSKVRIYIIGVKIDNRA